MSGGGGGGDHVLSWIDRGMARLGRVEDPSDEHDIIHRIPAPPTGQQTHVYTYSIRSLFLSLSVT